MMMTMNVFNTELQTFSECYSANNMRSTVFPACDLQAENRAYQQPIYNTYYCECVFLFNCSLPSINSATYGF